MAFEVSGITVIDGTRNITANTIIASGITYPTSDGTSGQVLITDGSGNLSFSTVSIDGSSYQTKADALAANNTLVALIDDRMQVSNVSTLVSTEVSALVDSAPSTLDTLNELAAALGDDPNFATTVTNSIATKLPLAGGTMTGTIAGFTSTGIDDNATSTAITIDSSENVGIGTTSPLNKLVVSEGTGQHGIELAPGTTSYIQAYDRAIADYGDLKIDAQIIQFGTDNGTERMRISSAGDVQIGTAAVTGGRYFDIYNTGSTATDFAITRFITQQVGSASTTSADIIKRKNGQFGFINNDTNSAAYINFTVGASERMRIDSSGNVGIGTSSPVDKLHVYSGASGGSAHSYSQLVVENSTHNAIQLLSPDSTEQALWFGDASSSTAGGVTYYHPDNIMTFRSNGSERMRINSSGNVGIGTTSPTTKLDVIGSSTNGSGVVDTLRLRNTGTSVGDGARIQFTAGTSTSGAAIASTGVSLNSADLRFYSGGNTERMRIDSSGNLLVGRTDTSFGAGTNGAFTTSGGRFLNEVNGDTCLALNRTDGTGSAAIVFFYRGNTAAGQINAAGGGTPAFASSSDIRLKNNVTDHESELTNVMSLRPVRWDWNNLDGVSGEGFIAQELEQTAWADLVSEGDDGYKQVSGLGAVETRLIKALQEAVTRIETLEAEVAALKGA